MKPMKPVKQCGACARFGLTHKHHMVRAENDPTWITPLCIEDHIKKDRANLTAWHERSGIVPGLDSAIAGALATLQYVTFVGQRQNLKTASHLRRAESSTAKNARKNGKRWAKPTGVGKSVGDPDELFALHSSAHQISEYCRRLSVQIGLSPGVRFFARVGYEFWSAVCERPLAYLEFASKRDYSYLEAAWIRNEATEPTGELFDTVRRDFERHFIAEAWEFLHLIEGLAPDSNLERVPS